MTKPSKSGHTPGPWHFGNAKAGTVYNPGHVWDSDEFQVGSVSGFPLSWTLGDCEHDGGFRTPIANARLISLAPEMYEALNKALAFAVTPEAFDRDRIISDWRALLAKLEGK